VGLRQAFLEALADEDVTRFVFVDETSTNLTYCRRYGRAPAGERVNQAVPLHNGRPQRHAYRRPATRRIWIVT